MRLVVLNGCVEAARARAEGRAVTKVRDETYAFASVDEWDNLDDDSGIALRILLMNLSRIWEVGRGDRCNGGNTASLFIYGSPV
jgi:hypothetical protein